MFVILSVIYRPIEQLLSRTIADRRGARAAHRPSAADAAADPGRLRARLPRDRAGAARTDRGRPVRRLLDAVLGPGRRRARLRRELLRARLARRAPVVRALRRRSCSWRRSRGCCSRSRWRSGSRRGSRWWRWAWRPRRSYRSWWSRSPSRAGRRREPAPRRRPADAEGARAGARRALRGRRAVHHDRRADAAQRRRAGRRPDGREHRRRGLRVQRDADRARAAAALPGDPGLAAPPPRGPRGARRRRADRGGGRTEFERAIRITVAAIAGVRGRRRGRACSRSARS